MMCQDGTQGQEERVSVSDRFIIPVSSRAKQWFKALGKKKQPVRLLSGLCRLPLPGLSEEQTGSGITKASSQDVTQR